jgi:hypothetical protein
VLEAWARSAPLRHGGWPAGRSAKLHAVLLTLCVLCIALFIYAIVGALEGILSVHVYWAGAVSTVAFAAVQLAFPSCRPRWDSPLCPVNWALLAFFFQLVVLPLLIAVVGPVPGTLPRLPSEQAINRAILVVALSFIGFGVGYQAATCPKNRRAVSPYGPTSSARHLIALFAVLGVVGFYLKYQSASGFFAALTDPSRYQMTDEFATLAGAASTFLRPFLLAAIVLGWCRWVDFRASASSTPSRVLVVLLATAGVILAGASFEFNRSAIVVPLLSMAATYSAKVKRLGVGAVAVLGFIAVGPVLLIGNYRSGGFAIWELVGDRSAQAILVSKLNFGEQLQVYGMSPQYLGFMLEEGGDRPTLSSGRMLLASIMYPVPVLGKPFREASGVVVYNKMIYGENGTLDQVVPFQGELFLSFHIIGVFFGFCVVGWVLARLQAGFDRTGSAFASYVYQYTATWVAFLIQGSLAVLSQILVFFFWPIYAWAAWSAMSRYRRQRRPLAVPGSSPAQWPAVPIGKG